ncbi:MAG: ROK family transcriptional regulator [Lachnospiraceae bacterium]|nr:ROK family transcriptional regulator [Lachnospiraceae bacterium]
MIIESGNSLLETRRRNGILIKNKIFRTEHAMRGEIAKELGLTLPTITNSINEMIKEGVVEPEPLPEECLSGGYGRKPQMVRFRREAGYSIGIELGAYHTRAVLVNLRGEVVEERTRRKAALQYGEMLAQVTELIGELCGCVPSLQKEEGKLIGIGIGVPGFVDTEGGTIRQNFRVDWNGRPLGADLRERYPVPILIDNNTRFRAMGYEMQLRGTRPKMFAYLFISRGLACPIMYNDLVLSGAGAGAGELGQTILLYAGVNGEKRSVTADRNGSVTADRNGSVTADQKRTVTADQIASESALFERCMEEMERGRLLQLKKSCRDATELSIGQILDLQQAGDPEIDALVEECIFGQALVMANVVNLLNPNTVVVDARMMSFPANREKLIRYARAHFYGMNAEDVEIRFHEYHSYDGALGAALGTIQKNFLNA